MAGCWRHRVFNEMPYPLGHKDVEEHLRLLLKLSDNNNTITLLYFKRVCGLFHLKKQ